MARRTLVDSKLLRVVAEAGERGVEVDRLERGLGGGVLPETELLVPALNFGRVFSSLFDVDVDRHEPGRRPRAARKERGLELVGFQERAKGEAIIVGAGHRPAGGLDGLDRFLGSPRDLDVDRRAHLASREKLDALLDPLRGHARVQKLLHRDQLLVPGHLESAHVYPVLQTAHVQRLERHCVPRVAEPDFRQSLLDRRLSALEPQRHAPAGARLLPLVAPAARLPPPASGAAPHALSRLRRPRRGPQVVQP
mmetsp:Transcript_23681/g.74101  ORF Transcript_23681/g.74101 Transcript_23681/m.74101 type:complete len:252 (+) Transcript_23681:114-869(+)|eukprot:CAMPEP_0197403592 /NCGR_PEP_ID=MMETSP1165-20131217/21748_1 /TAXON_ID=284809 /ORGANISM="Chrysocystis fragilis, Strain CCMP3189" /LENGTH=251 /DNA_ID=CAMNT_0042929813 /DNA_START=100 /DNA_END=855 /DNA_ORIENTATION=-